MPVAYGTAHRMVVGKGAVKAGDKVLVLGASGGVGTAAVLLAKQLGAYVVAAVGSKERGNACWPSVRTITSTIARSGSINGPARTLVSLRATPPRPGLTW